MHEHFITMKDGTTIYAFAIEPTEQPIGHLHILHGMAEHIGRYHEFAEVLAARGFLVTGHDHRGHGKTADFQGHLGHFGDGFLFDQLVHDADEVITYFERQYEIHPRYLFGHSMGSFVGRRYIQLYGNQLQGAIFSGTGNDPGIARLGGLAIAKCAIRQGKEAEPSSLLNQLTFGGFNKTISKPKSDFDWLSRNEDAVATYIEDSYCGFIPTNGFFQTLFEGLGRIHEQSEIAKIPKQLPLLFISGTDDPVGKAGKGVWKVAKTYEKAGLHHCTVYLFEGGRHEMLHELNAKHVHDTIYRWLVER